MLAACLAACGGGAEGVDPTVSANENPSPVTNPAPPVVPAPQARGNGCDDFLLRYAEAIRVVAEHAGVSYGVDSTATYTATADVTLAYPAPEIERKFLLAVGQSTTASSGNVITYLARESVTVPAGTFEACKYDETYADSPPYPGGPDRLTSWIAVGYGISVKTVFSGFLFRRESGATSITIDGRRL